MARELDITIQIRNAEQAKAELARVDAEIAKVTQSLLKGTTSLEDYEAAIKGLKDEQAKAKTTLQEYEKTLKPVDESQKKAASSASELVRAIGAMVTTGAVLGAIKQSLDYASSLEKMNAATGINTTGLQRLENVAIGASVSLNSITNSVLDLTRRLVLDDKNAAKGMAALGLETQRFLQLDGEQQFYAVARSIREITNEEERNAIAFQLFGRTYKEVLPALVSDVDGLKNSIRGLTEQQVEDLARAEVAWQQWKATAARSIAEVVAAWQNAAGSIPNFGGFFAAGIVAGAERGFAEAAAGRAQARGAFDAAITGAPTVGGMGLPAFPDAGELLRLQQAGQAHLAFLREQASLDKTAASARRDLAEATHQLYSELRNMEGLVLMEQDRLRPLVQQAEAGTPLTGPLPGATTPRMSDLNNVFDADVIAKVREVERAAWIANFGFQGMADGLENVGEKGKELDRIREYLASLAYELSPLHRGLSAVEDVLGGINNDFAEMVVVAARTIDTVMQRLSQGDVVGAVTASVAGIIQVFKGIGGPSQAELEARRMRDEWESGFDDPTNDRERWEDVVLSVQEAYARVGRSAEEANEAVAAIWAADDPREYAAAVREVDRVLRLIEDSSAKVQEAMERYGITVDQMGERWQAQRLDEQAQQLYQDYMLLIGAGVKQGEVLDAMGADLTEYFNNAQRLGLAIPEAMRPILQALVDQGKLVDENGQLITDLSNINFSENLTTQFRDLIGAVRDLVAVLRGELAPAISELPSVPMSGTSPGDPRGLPRFHDGGVIDPASNILRFIPRAHKGLAVDERLIVAQTGEGILSRGGMNRLGGPAALNALNNGEGGGSGAPSVYIDARGAYFGDNTDEDIANRVMNALARGAGRTKFNAMKRAS